MQHPKELHSWGQSSRWIRNFTSDKKVAIFPLKFFSEWGLGTGKMGIISSPYGMESESESHSAVSHSLWPYGLTQSMEFSRTENWSGWPSSSPWDLPNPGTEPRSPALQSDSLPAEPPGKPKNNVVGSLSLLHWIFLTQELNWGVLHCRWILYQLSY